MRERTASGSATKMQTPSVTSITRDVRHLPLSMTQGGVTTQYRYTDAGQRYYKKTGTGNATYYALDGDRVMGTFTLNSSGSISGWDWYIYGLDLVGRQPYNNNARLYYRDHLGSVRVTKGKYGVIWSTDDYYQYGLEMPGRSYASSHAPTRENYTGHELDAETGLLYAGARYYGVALARWGSVDPLAGKYAAWSPYNCVLGNPHRFIDPDGKALDDYLIMANGQVGHAETDGQDRFFVEEKGENGKTNNRPLDLGSDADLNIIADRLAGNDSFRRMVIDSKTAPNEVLALAGAVDVRARSGETFQTMLKVGAVTIGTARAMATGGGIAAGSRGLMALGGVLGNMGMGFASQRIFLKAKSARPFYS